MNEKRQIYDDNLIDLLIIDMFETGGRTRRIGEKFNTTEGKPEPNLFFIWNRSYDSAW